MYITVLQWVTCSYFNVYELIYLKCIIYLTHLMAPCAPARPRWCCWHANRRELQIQRFKPRSNTSCLENNIFAPLNRKKYVVQWSRTQNKCISWEVFSVTSQGIIVIYTIEKSFTSGRTPFWGGSLWCYRGINSPCSQSNAKRYFMALKKQKSDLLLISNLKRKELNLSQYGNKALMLSLFNFKNDFYEFSCDRKEAFWYQNGT